ncbi:hypothetical protein [Hymenobacter weizhouensis]|uniref:hypothetical protein n=1 Tax=Hymenobacter sp. YIM 151500-1 TaxID=2987689 RepID=UPI0022273BDB|nr:hypothetical protein [Hymenobacter sp. YIM 151500-1]UYZ64194.1 hypothetical protein OIS53_04935 [Hymenobacter sp. YIM 151500-1]
MTFFSVLFYFPLIMAYTDFTVFDLRQQFGVHFRAAQLFPDLTPVEPTDWLRHSLRIGQEVGFNSEKSRSERLVTPVLLELCERNNRSFSIYSGMNLDIDPAQGLRGECDFIFSFSRIQDFITAPVFCIAEAKKQDLEQGVIQCAAQLIAARKLNELEGNSLHTLYGCSTTGTEWRFLKYEGNDMVLDEKRYHLTELPALLGVLQAVLDHSYKQLAPEAS